MPVRILIIDDKPEEVKKAEVAVRKVGLEEGMLISPILIALSSIYNPGRIDSYNCVISDLKDEDISGVLTDLFYTPATNEFMVKNYGDQIPPGGLLTVIQCVSRKIPVVICTDASEGAGHGGLSSSWIVDGIIRPMYDSFSGFASTECNNALGVGINYFKDWEGATKALIRMIKSRK